ncbi:MAG: ComEC/Rec2 family competence protein [bacterium]
MCSRSQGSIFGVVAAIAWWLSTWIARRSVTLLLRWGESRVAAVGTLGLASAYVVFVGAPASACRAWVVVLCVCLGHLSYRKPCSVHAIAWGAATALAWDPLQIFDFGFQLSFAATLGIVLFSRGTPSFLRQPLFGHEPRWRRVVRWIGTFVGVSWAANLATMPVLLAQTGAMPMSSLLTNLVVVPWVSVVVFPVFMAGLAAGHIWAPCMVGWLASIVWCSLSPVWRGARITPQTCGSRVYRPRPLSPS